MTRPGRRLSTAKATPLQVGAYQDGRAAFGAGAPSTSCPFTPSDTDPGDPELRVLWVRGWVHARHEAAEQAYVELPDRHPSLTALGPPP